MKDHDGYENPKPKVHPHYISFGFFSWQDGIISINFQSAPLLTITLESVTLILPWNHSPQIALPAYLLPVKLPTLQPTSIDLIYMANKNSHYYTRIGLEGRKINCKDKFVPRSTSLARRPRKRKSGCKYKAQSYSLYFINALCVSN